MATNTKSVTKHTTKKPAAKKTTTKPVVKTAPTKKTAATPAETYKMVEALTAAGTTQQAAFAEVGVRTGRHPSTIQGVYFKYRRSIGIGRPLPTKPTPTRSNAPRAKAATKRASASSAATSATAALQALIDENALLRAGLAAAELRIERMLAAATK
jgi:hypothetical protein